MCVHPVEHLDDAVGPRDVRQSGRPNVLIALRVDPDPVFTATKEIFLSRRSLPPPSVPNRTSTTCNPCRHDDSCTDIAFEGFGWESVLMMSFLPETTALTGGYSETHHLPRDPQKQAVTGSCWQRLTSLAEHPYLSLSWIDATCDTRKKTEKEIQSSVSVRTKK